MFPPESMYVKVVRSIGEEYFLGVVDSIKNSPYDGQAEVLSDGFA